MLFINKLILTLHYLYMMIGIIEYIVFLFKNI
jgi:hypothetical protein